MFRVACGFNEARLMGECLGVRDTMEVNIRSRAALCFEA